MQVLLSWLKHFQLKFLIICKYRNKMLTQSKNTSNVVSVSWNALRSDIEFFPASPRGSEYPPNTDTWTLKIRVITRPCVGPKTRQTQTPEYLKEHFLRISVWVRKPTKHRHLNIEKKSNDASMRGPENPPNTDKWISERTFIVLSCVGLYTHQKRTLELRKEQ